MADEARYYEAFAHVRAGTADSEDYRLTTFASNLTGSFGDAAREALAHSGNR